MEKQRGDEGRKKGEFILYVCGVIERKRLIECSLEGRVSRRKG